MTENVKDKSKQEAEVDGKLCLEDEHVALTMTELEWVFGDTKLVLRKM